MNLQDKKLLLQNWLNQHGRVAIAFSGGVDSTFLLAMAKKTLGDKVIAVTVKTPYIPEWEMKEAVAFCHLNKIRHHVLNIPLLQEINQNPTNRCYLCKKHLFDSMKEFSLKEGFHIVADGSNADDTGVYRPGLAALHELEIESPLLLAGLTKADVRALSSEMGLPTAAKPSYACLLTRLPYNYPVDEKELDRIVSAELFLKSIGFAGARVRNHSTIARIEIEKDRIDEFIKTAESSNLSAYFHKIGYHHITLDLEGYRSGSFDQYINTLS